MKKILIISFITAILFFGGCKSADEQGEFTLSVTVSPGIIGTPETGTYYYNENDPVFYEYSLADNYSDLVVRLDGEDIESTGTIIISGNHSITTSAIAQFNVVGSWTMTEAYSDTRKFTVTIIFTGAKETGTVTDSGGGTGAYTVDSSVVNFTLQFSDATYEYTGTFSNVNSLGGSCTRTSLTTNEVLNGNWSADRDASAAVTGNASGKKGQG